LDEEKAEEDTVATATAAESSSCGSTMEQTASRRLARTITADLQKAAIPAKKVWWEKYLKGVISFYGVPMDGIRTIVRAAYDDNDSLTKITAFELLRGDVAEQKLAGILILQLVPHCQLTVDDLTGELHTLFADGYIQDWNTCDWLCVKALSDLVGTNDEVVKVLQTSWCHSTTSLWQKRASLVAFVQNSTHPAVLPIATTFVSKAIVLIVLS
jgi:3-methyladenine DNA glycosylase AlkD